MQSSLPFPFSITKIHFLFISIINQSFAFSRGYIIIAEW